MFFGFAANMWLQLAIRGKRERTDQFGPQTFDSLASSHPDAAGIEKRATIDATQPRPPDLRSAL